MKYVSLRTFEDASSALNFEAEGNRVVGGCDLYTTKAAGADKKLYKRIDKTLEAQYESQLRIAASLSPPQAKEFAKTANLSQSSPFGALSQTCNRRAYAYMIATLNASHPDYDFSNVLRPADFRRELRIKDTMDNFDSKVYGAKSSRIPPGLQTPGGSLSWGPKMWKAIDGEMHLYDCEVYSYIPEQNPFDDEESAIWSLHYFFFNKVKKRVCYLYARALSPSWTEESTYDDDDDATITPVKDKSKRRYGDRQSADFSARKRARFWLGDRAEYLEENEDDLQDYESEVDVDQEEDEDAEAEAFEMTVKRGRSMSSNLSDDLAGETHKSELRRKSRVRNMDEAVAEAIEL